MFTLPITIGDVKVEHAMCDLGASINVLPYSVYTRLVGARLVQTKVVIQLADRSCINPVGVLENFRRVKRGAAGRPFLRTAKTLIDVCEGTICLDYHGEKYTFSIDEAMKKPMDVENLHSVDVIAPLVQEYLEEEFLKEKFEGATRHNGIEAEKGSDGSSQPAQLASMEKVSEQESQPDDEADKNQLPQGEHSTTELKKLPPGLKYAYLGEEQEEKLMKVLEQNQKAIGWKLSDLVGISPDLCMHHIRLEEGAKAYKDPQRKLNPHMREEVLKEVLKLVSLGIIYSVPDSKWVSPVHMVPKKSGIQVVTNAKNELVSTRLVTGWRMCIDYRKLNAATKKDHFPLPFVDQMLERLAGKQYFNFLDGYSGYFEIYVDPEHQEKTTFTCPFGTYAYRRMPFGLCNAPGTFQRCMMSIFSDLLEECIKIFMDDFTVYGDTFEKCLHNLDLVLERCRRKSLVLNFEKCHFMVTEGIVLGHVVSERDIQVDQAKVDVIAKLPHPTNQKEIRGFLGHAGFYRRSEEALTDQAEYYYRRRREEPLDQVKSQTNQDAD
ncbi:hypothetical protein AAHA92_20724 [Salvia divinorum]|uniref:Reverse transcriptase domain-containing protein n=1 Tax=Salvia divinorum TaxID=28513 RepID=A0ABD1GIH0_SALDI